MDLDDVAILHLQVEWGVIAAQFVPIKQKPGIGRCAPPPTG